MEQNQAIEKSREYVMRHKKYVKLAYNLLIDEIKKEFPLTDDEFSTLANNIEIHDLTKLEPDQAMVYAKYFWEEKSPETTENYERVSLLHKLTNPHHPEFWMNENGETETMSVIYVIEMICDWWSFGLSNNNPLRILQFYQENKMTFKFSNETSATIEKLLYIIKMEVEKQNLQFITQKA